MTNTRMNGDLEELWYRWLDRIDYLHTDPYGYLRDMYDRYGLQYPSCLSKLTDKSPALSTRDIDIDLNTGKYTNEYDIYSRTNFNDAIMTQDIKQSNNRHYRKSNNLCCFGKQ